MIQAHVGRHTPHPRAEGALGIEGVDALVRADESLLRHVLGFAAFAQHTIADVEDARLMHTDKFAKRLGLTVTGAQDQVAVG